MPFTISHTAAILPFARPLARWRLLSATLIGSMVPDFGLLMPSRPARIETHGHLSLVTFCVPVGLATFWIFQKLLKRPIMAVLPDAAYARWCDFGAPADIGSLKQWALAACGVLAGAVSHLIWDGFTHEGARGVRMVPLLDDPVLDIAGRHLIGARLLQDVSSLIGLILVLAVIVYALRCGGADDLKPVRPLRPVERYVWISVYAAMTVLLAGLFLIIRRPSHASSQSVFLIGNYAIAVLRGFATALVLVSLCLRVRLRANP